MTVNNFYILMSVFSFTFLFGQEKAKYPKDTIYLKYEVKESETWNNKFERKFHKEMGIFTSFGFEKYYFKTQTESCIYLLNSRFNNETNKNDNSTFYINYF